MDCAKCIKKQLRENGAVDYWHCEHVCQKGKKEYNKERGTAWDMMDKQSAAYKRATLNGD